MRPKNGSLPVHSGSQPIVILVRLHAQHCVARIELDRAVKFQDSASIVRRTTPRVSLLRVGDRLVLRRGRTGARSPPAARAASSSDQRRHQSGDRNWQSRLNGSCRHGRRLLDRCKERSAGVRDLPAGGIPHDQILTEDIEVRRLRQHALCPICPISAARH
jgi:hypothetical protein